MAKDTALLRYIDSQASASKALGMPGEKFYLSQRAVLTKDDLTIGNWQVMSRWSKPYMKALASVASKNGGSVLEIGFGMGYVAKFIQQNPNVKKHTIIEVHPDVCALAEKMFKKEIAKGKIRLIKGFWEDAVKKLKKESFDGVLFDSYDLAGRHKLDESKAEFRMEEDSSGKKVLKIAFSEKTPFFNEAYSLLRKGGVFTYHLNKPKGFAQGQPEELRKIGFSKIDYKICRLNPSKDCLYCRHKTLVAPIITK